MKKIITFIGSAALALLSTSVLADAYPGLGEQTPATSIKTTYPQKNKPQIHSRWCWNAAVRNFMYTESRGRIDEWQCHIANYAFGVGYACHFDATFEWKNVVNRGNWNKRPKGATDKDNLDIVRHYGFKNAKHQLGELPFASLRQSIDDNHSVLTHWRYRKGGGGHMVVAYGYHVGTDGSRWVKLADPWPGEGDYWISYEEYGNSSRDHWISSTIRVVN